MYGAAACVAVALTANVILIAVRCWWLGGREFTLGRRFSAWLGASCVSHVVAAAGFAMWGCGLSGNALLGDMTDAGLANALTVLSLLAAGAFAGYCALEYDKALKDERGLCDLMSATFIVLFYVLYGAISFYVGGLSARAHVAGIGWVVALVICLLLCAFSLIDIWDYRAPHECCES